MTCRRVKSFFQMKKTFTVKAKLTSKNDLDSLTLKESSSKHIRLTVYWYQSPEYVVVKINFLFNFLFFNKERSLKIVKDIMSFITYEWFRVLIPWLSYNKMPKQSQILTRSNFGKFIQVINLIYWSYYFGYDYFENKTLPSNRTVLSLLQF